MSMIVKPDCVSEKLPHPSVHNSLLFLPLDEIILMVLYINSEVIFLLLFVINCVSLSADWASIGVNCI